MNTQDLKPLRIYLILNIIILLLNGQYLLGDSIDINHNKRYSNERNNLSRSAELIPSFGIPYHKVERDILTFNPQLKLGKFIPLNGNLEQLKYFFNALKNAKNKKVRIAHYGDSLIMGDLITETLREKFQETFSGRGVGYLSIVSDDYRIRRTISQSSSDDWDYASFMTRNPEQLPYGINGSVAIPKNGSWAKYETTKAFKLVSSFDIFKVFYNNADKSSTI